MAPGLKTLTNFLVQSKHAFIPGEVYQKFLGESTSIVFLLCTFHARTHIATTIGPTLWYTGRRKQLRHISSLIPTFISIFFTRQAFSSPLPYQLASFLSYNLTVFDFYATKTKKAIDAYATLLEFSIITTSELPVFNFARPYMAITVGSSSRACASDLGPPCPLPSTKSAPDAFKKRRASAS
jgi:hypothetical protein